jgi:cell division protein FtsB
MPIMRQTTMRTILVVAAIGVAAFVGGCGQEVKQENERLKQQVSALQKENADLKNQVAASKAEADKTKQDMENAAKEWQAKLEDLQQQLTKRSGGAKAPAKR